MISTNLKIGDLGLSLVQKDFRNRCCFGSLCCTSSNEDQDNIVSFQVVTQKSSEEVGISINTPLQYVEKIEHKYLRPLEARDIKWPNVEKKTNEINKKTVAAYYDNFVTVYGAEMAAIVSAWKGIDFVHMLKNAQPLTISHVLSINEGLNECVKNKVECIFNSVILFFKESTIPTVHLTSQNELILERDSEETSNSALQKNKEKNIRAKFFELAIHKGLINEEEIEIIGNKLNRLRKQNDIPKLLMNLEKTDTFTQIEAEKLLRLMINTENSFEELTPNEKLYNKNIIYLDTLHAKDN